MATSNPSSSCSQALTFFFSRWPLFTLASATISAPPATPSPWVRNIGRKEMVAAAICGSVSLFWLLRTVGKKGQKKAKGRGVVDNERASVSSSCSDDVCCGDPALLRKHSQTVSVAGDGYTYPSLRIFYRPHHKASILPPKLPLLVFIHGLGGQLAQFHCLLEYFVHISHTLAIDLPGCGLSEFAPKDWDAYTTPALASLVAKIVNERLEDGQHVVLIGHSMGCALATTLATKGGLLADKTAGLIAVCPKAAASKEELKKISTAVSLPEFVFNLFRACDRRGGTRSKSVSRFVGKNATEQTRKLQLRFNEQSRTPVWRRMISGIRLPTREEWTAVQCPMYLLGASEDKVTKVEEVDLIHSWFDPANKNPDTLHSDGDEIRKPSTASTGIAKKCIIPSAGHAVLYESPQVLCGLIGEFLSKRVNETLSLGWQLSYLKEDKWLLKNLEKWNGIQPVSPRIVGKPRAGAKIVIESPFRAMKTLRQNDPAGHNPIEFNQLWSDVGDIIDISNETPPYDPETFGGGVVYHKFPIVSKIPPTPEEVSGFIALVDSIREKFKDESEKKLIVCHCHYGFNRTGFLICCYLIERLGFGVDEALEAFKQARPPGIRHPHFINELSKRYCLGLLKAPTF